MSRYTGPTQLQSQLVRSMYQWWMSNKQGDVPDQSKLELSELKELLPNMLISDVERDPFRIRYRIVGTKVIDATGLDPTGRCLNELIPNDPDEPWVEDYRIAYRTRRPFFGVSRLRTSLGVACVYEFGIFPLCSGDASIAQFVSIEDYFGFTRPHEALGPWKIRT